VYFPVKPPAPAIFIAQTAVAGNKWIGDQKSMAIRQSIKPGYSLDIPIVLLATM